MTKHECPVPGCRLMIARRLLMCRAHWFGVPTELRRALNAAWESARWVEYFALRDQAISSVMAGAAAPSAAPAADEGAEPSVRVDPRKADGTYGGRAS